MNLEITETFQRPSSVRGASAAENRIPDLQVHQCGISIVPAATVVMLDCSHRRSYTAKNVYSGEKSGQALSHLIRTRIPANHFNGAVSRFREKRLRSLSWRAVNVAVLSQHTEGPRRARASCNASAKT